MPNYIVALIFVLIATSIIIIIARDPLLSHYSKEEYRDYRNTWWFLTVCLFLSPGIWIFYAIVLITLLFRRYATDADRVATYVFLLFTAPSIEVAIPVIGGINRLFDLGMQRILILVVLLPIFRKSLQGGLSVNPSDKYVIFYILLSIILLFRQDNATHSARQALIIFIDVIIPYFVISRNLKSLQSFNRVLLVLMFALGLLAAESVAEAVRHWELYNYTGTRLIGEHIYKFSGERAGILRARSIFGSPIILGYAMVFLMALLLYLKPCFTKKIGFYILFAITGSALLVTFSRGAWIGGVVMVGVYGLLTFNLARAAWYILIGALVGVIALTMTQFGQQILNLLPFFGGSGRVDTFNYRARLLENGIILIKRNPWLGAHDYMQSPEMQAMRQGQGIIDTVNTFLVVAMRHGLIGLFLFVMMFIPSMWVIFRGIKRLPESEERFAQLGRMLLSFMVAALLIIFTVSNMDFVRVIYYMGAAFMAAWVGLYRNFEKVPQKSDVMVRNGRML